MATKHNGFQAQRVHLTTGSMSEIPFAVRLLEVSPGEIRISTQSLIEVPASELMTPVTLRPWAVGRPEDRTLTIPLN
jgi:hypothetical protein